MAVRVGYGMGRPGEESSARKKKEENKSSWKFKTTCLHSSWDRTTEAWHAAHQHYQKSCSATMVAFLDSAMEEGYKVGGKNNIY